MTLKTIYLARRNADISAVDFPRRWKEHSALAGQFARLQKYFAGVVQCAKLTAPNEVLGAKNDFDGVNLITMSSDSLDAATAFWDEPDTIESMRPDELRVFDRYVRDFSLVAQQQVLKPGSITAFGVITFLKRKEEGSASRLAERWGVSLEDVPAFAQLVRRHVKNVTVLPPPRGYEFDLVSEVWCDRISDLVALGGDAAYRAQMAADEDSLCDPGGSVSMMVTVNHSKGVTSP